MIDISELEQYFPQLDRPVKEGEYTFTIALDQNTDEETFIINLKIKQNDNKEDHLIKFRIGLGKDRITESKFHATNKPHFEIDIYRREKSSFSATAYFTLNHPDDAELMNYAKGTVHLISDIIALFFLKHKLDKRRIIEIVYAEQVDEELARFEPILIAALYECYKKSNLVIREGNEAILIKTEHNLSKYLNLPDLQPLYLPLMRKVKEEGREQKAQASE